MDVIFGCKMLNSDKKEIKSYCVIVKLCCKFCTHIFKDGTTYWLNAHLMQYIIGNTIVLKFV